MKTDSTFRLARVCVVSVLLVVGLVLSGPVAADQNLCDFTSWPANKSQPLSPMLLWEVRKFYASQACWIFALQHQKNSVTCLQGCAYQGQCSVENLNRRIKQATSIQRQQILKIKNEEWKNAEKLWNSAKS